MRKLNKSIFSLHSCSGVHILVTQSTASVPHLPLTLIKINDNSFTDALLRGFKVRSVTNSFPLYTLSKVALQTHLTTEYSTRLSTFLGRTLLESRASSCNLVSHFSYQSLFNRRTSRVILTLLWHSQIIGWVLSLQALFGSRQLTPTVYGVLSVEHCGKPAAAHDGMVFTVLVSVPPTDQQLPAITNSSAFKWCAVDAASDLGRSLENRLKPNMCIPLYLLGWYVVATPLL